MATPIPLPASLPERLVSPPVGILDKRPVSALDFPEWQAITDGLLRDVYGMNLAHPLMAGVSADDWQFWWNDPDRPTARMIEVCSVVAGRALCGVRHPLIAARADVSLWWTEETMRSRSAFPEWARTENRRLVVSQLFGESCPPEPPHGIEITPVPWNEEFVRTPMCYPSRTHDADLPAQVPVIEGEYRELVIVDDPRSPLATPPTPEELARVDTWIAETRERREDITQRDVPSPPLEIASVFRAPPGGIKLESVQLTVPVDTTGELERPAAPVRAGEDTTASASLDWLHETLASRSEADRAAGDRAKIAPALIPTPAPPAPPPPTKPSPYSAAAVERARQYFAQANAAKKPK